MRPVVNRPGVWLIAAEDFDPDAGEDGVGDGDGDEGDDEKTRRTINLCFINPESPPKSHMQRLLQLLGPIHSRTSSVWLIASSTSWMHSSTQVLATSLDFGGDRERDRFSAPGESDFTLGSGDPPLHLPILIR